MGQTFTHNRSKTVNGNCPFCKQVVELKKTAKVGDLVVCRNCDSELEIVSLKPVDLDWPLDDYEEYDDYDFDDDDEYEYEADDYEND